jgi:hypothetical protein
MPSLWLQFLTLKRQLDVNRAADQHPIAALASQTSGICFFFVFKKAMFQNEVSPIAARGSAQSVDCGMKFSVCSEAHTGHLWAHKKVHNFAAIPSSRALLKPSSSKQETDVASTHTSYFS